MSNSRQGIEDDILVRFWSLDHPRRSTVVWPVTDWPKLVFASEGTILLEAEDHVFMLPPNRAVWVKPGSRHRMTCFGPAKVRTLYFQPEKTLEAQARPMEVRPLMKELILETCRVGPLAAGNALHVALFELLWNEIRVSKPTISVTLLPTDEVARHASRLALEDSARWSDLSDLAREVGCSRRTLERRFRAETGMSLGRWHQQARLLKSVHYLASKSTVADAAFHVGYSSPSAFIHAFKAHFGVTPSEWTQESWSSL